MRCRRYGTWREFSHGVKKQLRRAAEAARWPAGSFAKSGGRVGKLTMAPDSDGDVRLQWPDGQQSGYTKAHSLTVATETEWNTAAQRARNRADVDVSHDVSSPTT